MSRERPDMTKKTEARIRDDRQDSARSRSTCWPWCACKDEVATTHERAQPRDDT